MRDPEILQLPVTLEQLKALYMYLETSEPEFGPDLENLQDRVRELLFQNLSVGDFENLRNQ